MYMMGSTDLFNGVLALDFNCYDHDSNLTKTLE